MNVVENLRKDSIEWISNLTNEEIHAIRKYSYNSFEEGEDKFYSRINAMLRGDIPTDSTLEKYIDIISKALKKSKTKRTITCYRRVNVNPVECFSNGDYFSLYQFISTSVIESKALPGKYTMVIKVPKGIAAGYIEKISIFPKQRELLLDKDCIYRLISVKGTVIEMEVIS